ncbi:hypothetical protein [Falsiporphyromonas endometrii]|uniref:Uncharacterized protein n=1 Tax=Falsiporphyromonas endometrii TaxID=1387297 RepID=A0ABV9K6U0_9PORP
MTTNTCNIKEKRKALLVNLFLFIYGLAIPFSLLVSVQIVIAVFTAIILIYCFFKQYIRMNIPTLTWLIIPAVFIVLKMPFEYDTLDMEGNIAKEHLISFLTIGLSGILIGSMSFNYKSFIKYGYKIAWINFIFLFFFPFTTFYGSSINYMRFGYALLPSVIFSFVCLSPPYKKKGAFLLFISSIIELLIFGARGATASAIIFILIYIYFSYNISILKKVAQ